MGAGHFVRDLLCGGIKHHIAIGPGLARRTGRISGLGWHYLSHENLPRQPQGVLVEEHLRDALIRLNPTIAAQPDRAADVLYRLRAIIMGVRSDGLVKANEEFAAWMTGEKSMPFGENGEHVTITLIDFDDLEQNQYVVTQQYTFRAGKTEKRVDLVLLINGMPLVLIEAKTPVRSSQSWLDGALQVHDDYERNVPEFFVPNVFSINPNCCLKGRLGKGNIIRHSFYITRQGRRRRYRCKECGRTFSSTRGTPYYRLHKPRSLFDGPFAGCKLLRTIPSMNLAVVTVGPLKAVIATETGSRIC